MKTTINILAILPLSLFVVFLLGLIPQGFSDLSGGDFSLLVLLIASSGWCIYSTIMNSDAEV